MQGCSGRPPSRAANHLKGRGELVPTARWPGGGCAPNAPPGRGLVVVKVGGSVLSRGSDFYSAAQAALDSAPPGRLVIVVSAMRGVTDLLLRAAGSGDESVFNAACYRMIEAGLDVGGKTLASRIAGACRRARRLLGAGEPWASARLVSLGEEASAIVMSWVLKELGVESRPLMGWDAGIVADGDPLDSRVDLPTTEARVRERLAGLLERGVVPVVAGYTGASPGGEPRLLGRGGSDVTAAVLGVTLGAEKVVIITIAGGVLSGDPGVVGEARLVGEMSYYEALEAARLGLRKFHPRTFDYIVGRRVMVEVRGLTGGGGTIIGPRDSGAPLKVVVTRGGYSLLEASGVVGRGLDAASAVEAVGLKVEGIASSGGWGSVKLLVRGPQGAAEEAARALVSRGLAAAARAEEGVAVVGVVGYGAGRPWALKAALAAAGGAGAVFQGAYSLGLAVPEGEARSLARRLHSELVLGGGEG